MRAASCTMASVWRWACCLMLESSAPAHARAQGGTRRWACQCASATTEMKFIPILCTTKAANGTITLVKVKRPGTRLEKAPVQALRAMIGEGIG